MEIVNRVSRMASIATKLLSAEVKIGLVPTLGAIHPGHLSLIQAARSMSDLVVVSIFVDRLEFFTDEEYQKHPWDITKDVDALKNENVDYIFAPLEQEMYPTDFSTYVEVADLGQKLPEPHRSIYLKGMPTSAMKMLHIIKPAFIFFGEKDGLKGAILRKMIRDLNINAEVVVKPIAREASGLAFATRNLFLTEAEKAAAPVVFRSLQAAQALILSGETQAKKISAEISRVLDSEPQAKLEYALVADPLSLEPLAKVEANALIAVGVKLGRTSLQDSLPIEKNRASPA